ncbi:MAG: efflux RND transporter permease subunit, partial [Gammaproteobacteria bacterium]
IGANIISAIDQAHSLIDQVSPHWPEGIYVHYSQDQSRSIKETLSDLSNNVVMATLLVMMVILASLGIRSAILVAISIPGSFLTAILIINSIGYTLNMVVLFSLILAVGMLVDGAIVVTEYADRRLQEGVNRNNAYKEAAQRMAWPIIASTATTLAAFMPLLFWPGITGEFMKYLPITLLATLSASLLMALIALPVVGSTLGRSNTRANTRTAHAHPDCEHSAPCDKAKIHTASNTFSDHSSWLTRHYLWVLQHAIVHPILVLCLALSILIGSFVLYGAFGHGVEFFPETDADAISVTVRGRGDLSLSEKDRFVREVENLLLRTPGLKTINTQVLTGRTQQDSPEDTIGIIQAELKNWHERAHADKIVAQLRQRTADFPGLIVEIDKRKDGPAQGFAIQLLLLSQELESLTSTTQDLADFIKQDPRIHEVRSSLPIPGIEWRYHIDRNLAARYGADVANIGSMIQMATNGVKVGEYRPGNTDEALDIIVRYPKANRHLESLSTMRVTTEQGLIPLSHFVTRQALPKVSQITRQNGFYLYKIEANPAPGEITNNVLQSLLPEIKSRLPDGIALKLGGDLEQQEESAQFLQNAFSIALFIMTIILVTQFNSFYQAALILSAVIFSTAGVLLGLLLKGEPFGIVMSGVGVIALAGIVVNNNIVLIDTYNALIKTGMAARAAAIETGRQRLRPVLLTTITTILGLVPMVMQINIALLEQTVSFDPPSAQWWTQLSNAIAGGLLFATLLTLIFTPCLLVLKDHRKQSQEKQEK